MCGSAVIDSLSLKTKKLGETSRWTVFGSVQVSPPLLDVLVRIAEMVCAALTERLIW